MPEATVSQVAERVIFVVGSRRSGTNWLQRGLGAHPDVVCTNGESFLFSRGLVPLMDRFHHGNLGSPVVGSVYAHREGVIGAIRQLCDVVFGDLLIALGPAERIVDRTPENVVCLNLIGEVYPEARVLHIIRDGRDVVRSLLSMKWGTKEAEVAAEEWRAAVVDGREQGKRLRHYREVRYEEVLIDPRAQFEEVFEWLGLPVTPAIMDEVLRGGVPPVHRRPDDAQHREREVAGGA